MLQCWRPYTQRHAAPQDQEVVKRVERQVIEYHTVRLFSGLRCVKVQGHHRKLRLAQERSLAQLFSGLGWVGGVGGSRAGEGN